MTQTPAGWHPAPDLPGQLRYWDGAQWTDQYAPGAAPPVAPAPRKRSRGKWIAIGAAVLVIGGCAAMLGGTDDSGGDDDSTATDSSEDQPAADDGDEFGAQAACVDFVERQLKAPSTADFGDEEVTQIRGPVWEVVGEVDAENGFGAMLRSDYVCRVKFKGDDEWTLVKMTGLS